MTDNVRDAEGQTHQEQAQGAEHPREANGFPLQQLMASISGRQHEPPSSAAGTRQPRCGLAWLSALADVAMREQHPRPQCSGVEHACPHMPVRAASVRNNAIHTTIGACHRCKNMARQDSRNAEKSDRQPVSGASARPTPATCAGPSDSAPSPRSCRTQSLTTPRRSRASD